tara:strand:+ start:94 stop:768 length:675 start_codon:yes stop_codon:yes gene_type:complete
MPQNILHPNRKQDHDFYTPFGPIIGYKKISDKLVRACNKECDANVGNDYSDNLVGKVTQEISMSKSLISEVFKEAYDMLFEYSVGSASRARLQKVNLPEGVALDICAKSAWFVRSFAGDYNPVHVHTDCSMTSIGFLKVSKSLEKEFEEDLKDHHSSNGLTQLFYGDSYHSAQVANSFWLKPTPGDFWVFPASLMHTAYPFRSKGERRSFSVNFDMNLTVNDKN